MLYWALTFFVVALIAAILGFGGVAIAAASIAKILFFVFLGCSCFRWLRTCPGGYSCVSSRNNSGCRKIKT
jgi:uncharacterized membrane protein YtjA (UPF0391 family)